jgi:hypothetical protein
MNVSLWLRLVLLLVVVQALSIGRSLIWPELIAANLPWPASPLNARFIAALYWMGALSALFCLFARDYSEVRITLIEIAVLTGVLLLLTLPHLGEFTPETFPYRWVILYTLDPLVIALVLWRMRGRDITPAGRSPLAALFLAYAALLALLGAVLLLAPEAAAALWPWALPPILAQVYSIFFLTFALGGVLAAREPRWRGVWVYVCANLAMLLLVIAVSLVHAERFKPGPSTWLWYAICAGAAVGFAVALLRRPRAPALQGVSA